MDQIKTSRGQNKGHLVIKVQRCVCLLALYSEYNTSININSIGRPHPPGMYSTMVAEGESQFFFLKQKNPNNNVCICDSETKAVYSQSGNVANECVRAFQQCPALG